jgi:hypothetical protein
MKWLVRSIGSGEPRCGSAIKWWNEKINETKRSWVLSTARATFKRSIGSCMHRKWSNTFALRDFKVKWLECQLGRGTNATLANVTLTWSYFVMIGDGRVEQPEVSYAWAHDSWSPCSATCGSGLKTSAPICRKTTRFFLKKNYHPIQSDQIGRIFVDWASIYFEQLFENYRSCPYFWATFFHGKGDVLILIKNGLGYILGHFLQTHLVTLTLYHRNHTSKSRTR